MENKVTLTFKKDIVGLAGYKYGRQIYEDQVSGKIDINKDFYIEIPKNIEFIASSFVQGFFSDILEKIGLSSTEKHTNILSENDDVKNDILSKLIWI